MAIRIRELRKDAGLTLEQLARRIGPSINYQTIQKLERGERRLTVEWAKKIARALNVHVTDLDSDLSQVGGTVPLMGYVGAGDVIYPVEDAKPTDRIEIDLGADDLAAVVVRGASMRPAYCEGDLLFYLPDDPAPLEDVLGKDCVIMTDDGKLYVKQIFRGSSAGRFRLASHNAPAMDDVVVTWAARIRWIRRA